MLHDNDVFKQLCEFYEFLLCIGPSVQFSLAKSELSKAPKNSHACLSCNSLSTHSTCCPPNGMDRTPAVVFAPNNFPGQFKCLCGYGVAWSWVMICIYRCRRRIIGSFFSNTQKTKHNKTKRNNDDKRDESFSIAQQQSVSD